MARGRHLYCVGAMSVGSFADGMAGGSWQFVGAAIDGFLLELPLRLTPLGRHHGPRPLLVVDGQPALLEQQPNS